MTKVTLKLLALMIALAMLPIAGIAAAETTPRDKISIMMQVFWQEAPPSTNKLQQALSDFTNTDVNIIWVPAGNYEERFTIAVASDELPDAVATPTNIKNQAFINAALGGQFWDISDKLKDYPNLSSHYKEAMLKNATIDGKLFGLPRARPLTRDGMVYRKDWADALGLDIKQPITLDGIYEILKAFATQDPDGDGDPSNTYGLLMAVGENGALNGGAMQIIDVAYGLGNEWQIDENGDFQYVPSLPGHIQSLNWFKRLYDEGLMNRDFATVGASKYYELLDQEVGGFGIMTLTDAHERLDTIVSNVRARRPDLSELPPVEAKTHIVDTIYQIEASDGTIRAHTQSGFNGWWAFPKKTNPTEADLERVMNWFDMSDSPEGQAIIQWGIEGWSWDYDESGIARMTSDSQLFSSSVQPYWQLFCTNRETDNSAIKGYVAPMYEKVYAEMASLMPNAVTNPTTPLLSQTYLQDGGQLDALIYDAEVQYIMGLIDEDGWWAAVEEWKNMGGDQVAKEYTEMYHKLNG